MQGIGKRKVQSSKYVVLGMWFPGTNGTAFIEREIHLVDDLKANRLIGIDIMKPERVLVDFDTDSATFRCCGNVSISVKTRYIGEKQSHATYTCKRVVSPLRTQATVQFDANLADDRDMIYEPGLANLAALAAVVDHTTDGVVVINHTDVPMTVQKNARLGRIIKYDMNRCFVAEPDLADLAEKPLQCKATRRTGWFRRVMKAAVLVMKAAVLVTATAATMALSPGQIKTEFTHNSEVTVYAEDGNPQPFFQCSRPAPESFHRSGASKQHRGTGNGNSSSEQLGDNL